ncbi:puromycin N-acetyltransferase [Aspergillus udagawae]|nr:puromycin N-acetyltransferase [Aspergillus udagawae]
MLPTNISLHPAVPADALTLAKLHNAAFANEDLLETMYGPLTQEDPPFATDLEKMIRDDPHSQVTKAIDDESGQIVGWSLWNIYRDAEAHAKSDEEARKRAATPPATSLCPQLYLDYQALKASMRAKWIGGRPAAILQVLVVHPDYQGRGIGTQLLMLGVEEARRLRLPSWLEASQAGYSVYRRCGFRDAELMELDFTKYGLMGMRQVYCMLMDDVEKY